MFQGWESYFFLIGSASAGLIGLLFVVVTLTTNLDPSNATSGANVFMTPIVFHYGVVLVLSGLAMAPGVTPGWAAVGGAAAALTGLAYSVSVIVRILDRRTASTPPHWSDVWCYGVVPALVYVALCVDAAAFGARVAWATAGLAVMLMALLLISVRNAWDLVTWLAPRRTTPASSSSADPPA